MGINNPVPQNLGKESRKAARVLSSFIKPNQIIRYDEVIPPHVLRNAKGLAILTVLKAGFLFSGRAGSGVIVARLPDGTWSPPSAIMTAGAGVGGMIGAELTDFIFVLNNREAVNVFSKAGSLTLGGNISLAAGPLGRSAEAAGAGSAGGVAAIFSYAKTKGLYAGVSLEGSVLVERRDANRKFYGSDCSAKAILSGRVPAPRAVEPLFRVLDSRAFNHDVGDDFASDLYDDIPDWASSTDSHRTRGASRRYDDEYDDDASDVYDRSRRHGAYDRSSSRRDSARRYVDDDEVDELGTRFSRSGIGSRDDGFSARDDRDYEYERRGRGDRHDRYDRSRYDRDRYDRDRYDRDSDNYSRAARDRSDLDGYDRDGYRSERPSRAAAAAASANQAVALYTFKGEQSGDLSFKKGDVVNIVQKSDSTDDWWTGEIAGEKGIFPANYVELV